MSDPIADILKQRFNTPHQVVEKTVKQIRQQIGRELLYKFRSHHLKFVRDIIREVCQMEQADINVGDIYHCDEHGGYGFRSDCVECKKGGD